jgi:hypothetical protein
MIIPIDAQAQDQSDPEARGIGDPRKFDEWFDIPFSDEKARLDNAAFQLQRDPGYIIYLVIYAGQRACVGEAQARGIRAKNYLTRKHGIKSNQIVWIDGGYRMEVTVEVWIWPPDMIKPSVFPEFDLKPSEVKLNKRCRIKYRGRQNR